MNSNIKKIKYFFLTLCDAINFLFFCIISRKDFKKLRKEQKKPIWLFCDRGTDAKDNGFILFVYVRKNHPEIDAYYVISEKSKGTIDYKKVQEVGNILHQGTYEHKLYFLVAEALISSHVHSLIEPWRARVLKKFSKNYREKKNVFLKHGITLHNISDRLGSMKNNFSIFVTGAKPEYDYVLKTFGFTEDVVKYTGLARFDLLHDFTVKDQILLMPTWRQYIMQPSLGVSVKNNDKDFLKTDYYKTYQSLINSRELDEFLTKSGKQLIFYPHFEVQRYLTYFTTNSQNITIADKDHYDVQQLLKESQLLITDYSSIIFDFAYMKKPMILYQFDEEKFFAMHYRKGYFEHRTDGFGPVVITEKELLQNLVKASENNFTMSEKYMKRMDRFFPLWDRNNRERIVEVIKDLKNNKK